MSCYDVDIVINPHPPEFKFGGTEGSFSLSSPNCRKKIGILCGNVGFLTLLGVWCWRTCETMRSSEKPEPFILHDTYHDNRAGSLWIEMLVQASLGEQRGPPRGPAGHLPSRLGPRARNRIHPRLDKREIVLLRCAVQAGQGVSSFSARDSPSHPAQVRPAPVLARALAWASMGSNRARPSNPSQSVRAGPAPGPPALAGTGHSPAQATT